MKRIVIENENIQIQYISDELLIENITIDFGFKNPNGEYVKFLTLKKDTDINISFLDVENDEDIVNLYINKEDIIYSVFDKFLLHDENIKINSDDKRESNVKYVEFKKEKDNIVMEFVNKTDDIIDKHNIFIKNIMFDLRSKEENNNLKNRILELFDDFKQLFKQSTIKEKTKEYKMS